MNYNNLICRLCLFDASGNVSIFTSYDADRNGYLAHKIMQIANVQVYEGDGLPPLICRGCLNRVEGYFQFKIQVEKSDYFLRQQVCSYQAEPLPSAPVEKLPDDVKSEPLPVLKNGGVYMPDTMWTDSVQSFTSLQNCESLADTIAIPAQEVSDVLVAEESRPAFEQLARRERDEDKSLLDLTQQDGKPTEQPSEPQGDHERCQNSNSVLGEGSVTGKTGEVWVKNTGNHYINNFFNRSDGLDIQSIKGTEKVKNFYNLDQGKGNNSLESTIDETAILESSKISETNETEGENNDGEEEDDNDDCEDLEEDYEENDPSLSDKRTCKSKTVTITYCDKCDKHFEKPVSLKKHYSLHSKESYKCSFCNKSFRQSWYLQSHVRSHTGERPFACTICSKTFTDKSALNAHLRIAHFTEKTHVCNFCGKAFKLKKQLERHKLMHTGHHYHRCEICGNLFTQKSNLMKHLILHSGEKPFPCPECAKPFAQKDNLNIHILRHHSPQTPVDCDLCGKQFKNKMTLMGHKKSKHSDGIKQIICEVCGKFFPDRSCLNSHKWVHSASSPVQCDVCGKSYPHPRAVRVHKRIVHSEVRKYCCDVCGIGFKTSQTLKHHKVVHTGERAFSCEECGRSFGQKTALKTHQRIHSGLEPYSCSRCGESFKWKQTCDKHTVKCIGKPRRECIAISDNLIVS
uniref:Protein krueppel n=1 Tax=Graphocephala atropunctata TaxID=36148 RepID=A0A1B6MBH0_9HEMI